MGIYGFLPLFLSSGKYFFQCDKLIMCFYFSFSFLESNRNECVSSSTKPQTSKNHSEAGPSKVWLMNYLLCRLAAIHLKLLSNSLKQLGTIFFSKCRFSRRKTYICWGTIRGRIYAHFWIMGRGINYIRVWIHRQYLLIGSINYWFCFFLRMNLYRKLIVIYVAETFKA